MNEYLQCMNTYDIVGKVNVCCTVQFPFIFWRPPPFPLIKVRFFSAVVPLNIRFPCGGGVVPFNGVVPRLHDDQRSSSLLEINAQAAVKIVTSNHIFFTILISKLCKEYIFFYFSTTDSMDIKIRQRSNQIFDSHKN